MTQDVTNSIANMNIDSPDEVNGVVEQRVHFVTIQSTKLILVVLQESPIKSPNATINEDQLPAVIGHPSKEQEEAICTCSNDRLCSWEISLSAMEI